MANDTLIQGTTLTAIADAIRAKTETTDVMYPSEMAGKILSIEAGGSGTLVIKAESIYTKDSLPEGQITSSMGDVEVVKFKPKYSGEIRIYSRIEYSGSGSIYIKINGTEVDSYNSSGSSGLNSISGKCKVVKDVVYTVTVNTTNTAKCTYTKFRVETALFLSELLTII